MRQDHARRRPMRRRLLLRLGLILAFVLGLAGLAAPSTVSATNWIGATTAYFISNHTGGASVATSYQHEVAITWQRAVVRCSNTGNTNHFGAQKYILGDVSQYICPGGGSATQVWTQVG